MKVSFTVKGEPVGKGRPRFTKSGRTFTPAKTSVYEQKVRNAYWAECGNYSFKDDAIAVKIHAFYKIPKSTSKILKGKMADGHLKPTKLPDADNVMKAIFDALNGIAYEDDRFIIQAMFEKDYPIFRDCQSGALIEEEPRVEVTIMHAYESEVYV